MKSLALPSWPSSVSTVPSGAAGRSAGGAMQSSVSTPASASSRTAARSNSPKPA